jgi:hypothetical protein
VQRFDAISILVTALVFLGLSAGIFALIKASLRQVTPYGVVRIRPTRPFFVVGGFCELGVLSAACLCGYGVVQLGPQAVGTDNLAVVWVLGTTVPLVLMLVGLLVSVGWLVVDVIRDLRKRHVTVSQGVATYAPALITAVGIISGGIVGILGRGWYLLPLGVLDLVCVLCLVLWWRMRRQSSSSRQQR